MPAFGSNLRKFIEPALRADEVFFWLGRYADAAEGPLAVGLDPRQDATVDGDAVNAERVSDFVD